MPSLKTKLASFIALVAIASPPLTVSLLTLSSVPPTLAQTNNARKVEADELFLQGTRQLESGQNENSIQSWKKALNIYQKIGDHRGQAATLLYLGAAYDSLELRAKSIECYQQALDIYNDVGGNQFGMKILR